MNRIKIAVFSIMGLIFLAGLSFFLIGLLRPKVAGVYIESSPVSTVFINGQEVGKTPHEQTIEPGESVIKLVPDSGEAKLETYETKVSLIAGVKTVINRDFGATNENSAGELISFEKIASKEVSLAVVTIPDSARLIIDGRERAFTPHKTSSILPGTHTLTISSEGFKERVVEVKTHEGYKLTAVVKLAKASEDSASPTPTPNNVAGAESDDVISIEILSTPTGFLRVRTQPSSLAEEVGRVNPGERYKLIEHDQKTGWYKIELEVGEGWISSQYAKKIGQEVSPTPAAKITPVPTLGISPNPTVGL